MRKFTVIWGNIGGDHDRRLDHVEAEANHGAIMLAAAQQAVEDTRYDEGETPPTAEEFLRQEYDLFAILDGHVYDSALVSAF